MGKLRGIRSRPTSKWEIQGDQDQTPPATTAAGGTHPTGMHSCQVSQILTTTVDLVFA